MEKEFELGGPELLGSWIVMNVNDWILTLPMLSLYLPHLSPYLPSFPRGQDGPLDQTFGTIASSLHVHQQGQGEEQSGNQAPGKHPSWMNSQGIDEPLHNLQELESF